MTENTAFFRYVGALKIDGISLLNLQSDVSCLQVKIAFDVLTNGTIPIPLL